MVFQVFSLSPLHRVRSREFSFCHWLKVFRQGHASTALHLPTYAAPQSKFLSPTTSEALNKSRPLSTSVHNLVDCSFRPPQLAHCSNTRILNPLPNWIAFQQPPQFIICTGLPVYDLKTDSNFCISAISRNLNLPFLNTLQEGLTELEAIQQELHDSQTYILQGSAPLDMLAQVQEAVTYLSNQHWAILQLTRIASNLLAVIQALLHSENETSSAFHPYCLDYFRRAVYC